MNHAGTVQLKTPRLVLRQFQIADAETMYRNWASDPEVTKFMTWPTHNSADISRMVLESWVRDYSRPDFYQWAIILKENGSEPIGSIGGFDGNDQIGKIEIGYCMGRKWWGRGIMTEALGAAMWYLFDIVGYNRIQACHDADNPASGAVMRKCGMRCEGIFRQAGANNQGICDLVYYAMLSSDRK